MGKFDFQFDPELTKQLERLSNFDEIAENMLKESAPILSESIKRKIKASGHVDTGELMDSIKAKKPIKKSNWYVLVVPTGNSTKSKYRRKRGQLKRKARVKELKETELTNAAKLVFIEYGTSKQPATPILTSAVNDVKTEVEEKLQEVFNKAVNSK